MERIRQWRKDNGKTQAHLAEAIAVHPTAISKLESGDMGLDLHTFYRLVCYTGIDPMRLLHDFYDDGRCSAVPRGEETVRQFRASRRRRHRAKAASA